MNSCPSRFAVALALLAVLAAAYSVAAQQTILYSKPVEGKEEKANAFLRDSPSKLQGRAGQYNAPKQLFSLPDEPSLPPPQLSPMPSQSLRDALNKRKNWTLMTPEEIIGLPTPEKILGLPDPTGDDKRTVVENFLRRHDRETAFSATNALRHFDGSLLRNEANPFTAHDPRDPNGDFSKPDARVDTGSRKYFDRLVTSPAEPSFGAGQNADSAWSSAFAQPAPLPKPNVEQIAAMERFRAIMEPSAPPEKTPVATRFSTAPATAANPEQPGLSLFNPLGKSFTSLQSSISRPTGITPLPSLTSPHFQPATPKKPLTQLPPWLSKDPKSLENPFSPFNTRTW